MKQKLDRVVELNNTLKEMNVSFTIRVSIIKMKYNKL